MSAVVIGARVKSGWASAVLVAGSRKEIRFLDRARLLLSDPRVPRSSQPYHRGFGHLQTDASVLKRLTGIVRAAARESLAAFIKECGAKGHRPVALALVVGSTIDPERVTNEHIRAHAHEGQLFRMALEEAAAELDLRCTVARERDLGAASAVLGPSGKTAVAELVQEAGRPWRSDEKLAALAAWLVAVSP